MKRNYELDMCNGPLLSHIIIFALPLMLSGILQLLFNAADIIVVGRFTGSEALAAVGSTSSLINLLVNLFLGISVGGNVLMARYCGARDEKNARETVHTAICISIIGGVFMIFIGNLLARPLLEWMGTPADVIDLSVIYMRIYFLGMPAFITYDFGAALLRAVGDTRRPLYFLLAAGIINVIFNLVFVIVFRLGVAGVALATIIAQSISAVLVLICLIRSDGVLHLCKGELRIHPDKVKGMLRIGLPAGIQGCIFNISNVLIQSSVNSFGSLVMAGNTAASNIEGFVYTSMNAVYQTSLSFTGQNMGARNYQRVDRILFMCLGVVAVVGIVLGGGAVLFGTPLLGIYTNDPQVIAYGLQIVRHHGYAGRQPARHRLFAHANDRLLERSLPVQGLLDLYDLSGAAYTVFALRVLSDLLDLDGWHSCHMLSGSAPARFCQARSRMRCAGQVRITLMNCLGMI